MSDPEIDWEKVVARKDEIVRSFRAERKHSLRERGIERLAEPVRFRDRTTLETPDGLYKARKVVVATGSRPIRPSIPGIEHAIDSTDFLSLTALPPRLLVIGGGTIGMEFASVVGQMHSTVTVLEAGPAILAELDEDLRRAIEETAREWRATLRTGVQVRRIDRHDDGLWVTAGNQLHKADLVLVATGRGPNVEGLGLEAIGVRVKEKGIAVDEFLETDAPGVYAAGDVRGKYQLTPVAHYEGKLAARNALLGNREKADYRVVPQTVFTIPSASWVGLTEARAREKGLDFVRHLQRFSGLGAAVTTGQAEGFVKVLSDRRTGQLLGAHLFGAASEEIIHVAALAMRARVNSAALLQTLTIHPSLTEAFFGAVEGAVSAKGKAPARTKSRARRRAS